MVLLSPRVSTFVDCGNPVEINRTSVFLCGLSRDGSAGYDRNNFVT